MHTTVITVTTVIHAGFGRVSHEGIDDGVRIRTVIRQSTVISDASGSLG